jgi:hypothetical protein
MGGMALTPGSPSVPGRKGARAHASHASGVARDGAHAACLTIEKLTPLIAYSRAVLLFMYPFLGSTHYKRSGLAQCSNINQ